MRAVRLLVAAAVAALAVAGSAHAGSLVGAGTAVDTGADYNGGKALPFAPGTRATARAAARAVHGTAPVAAVGDERMWFATDDVLGTIYLKNYTLRAIGDHIEVWVASDSDEVSTGTQFPAGDCRNDSVDVKDDQIQAMIREFERRILPAESEAFSVAPARDGSLALTADVGLPDGYWAGEGDNVVVLVDNVRDDNFYDPNDQSGYGYIIGFFYSVFNELADRNVMTVDAFDWLHRLGASPPNEPFPDDPCLDRPAIPYLFEATFAHEYQHLLHNYTDPDETTWMNEGLSMYAEWLLGYFDLEKPIGDVGFSFEIQCLLGNMGEPGLTGLGGPENSLTLWGDQGDSEISCDYGAAQALMVYLATQRGPGVLSALHVDDANGLPSLRAVLRRDGASQRAAREVLHDWAATLALDSVVDHGWSLERRPVRSLPGERDRRGDQLGRGRRLRRCRRTAQRLRLRAPARRCRKLPAGEPDPLDRVRRGRDAPDAAGRVGGRPQPARARGRSRPPLGLGLELGPGDHLRGDGSRGASRRSDSRRVTTRRSYGTTASSRSRPTVARRSGALRVT